MTRISVPAATLVASLLASNLALAQDTVLGPHGSTLGTAFSTAAPTGEHLRRIEIRAGAFVDAIRLVYETRTDVLTTTSPWYGGTSGILDSFAIAGGDYLARVDVWSADNYVNRVRFTTNLGVQQTFGLARAGETMQAFALNQREVVGFVGRATTVMTALGIVVRPILATHEVFGTGCAGSAGTPTIGVRPGSGSGPFVLGGRVIVDGGSMPTGAAAILYYGASTTSWLGLPLPILLDGVGAPGCQVRVSLDLPILTQVQAGGITGHTLIVPNNTALLGGSLGFQWLVRDPAANALGFVLSPGLRVMVGAL